MFHDATIIGESVNKRDDIRIEGLTYSELLELSPDDFRGLALTGNPIVFRMGSAAVLGRFAVENSVIVIELAQIDGGGEGVLPTIAKIVRQVAIRERAKSAE